MVDPEIYFPETNRLPLKINDWKMTCHEPSISLSKALSKDYILSRSKNLCEPTSIRRFIRQIVACHQAFEHCLGDFGSRLDSSLPVRSMPKISGSFS